MLSDESKNDILNFVLKLVYNISNKDYQKRVWIRGEGPECDDFSETVNHFFNECGPLLDEYKDFRLTNSQYITLKTLYDEFDNFLDLPSLYDHIDFISTPEWENVMEKAKDVLQEFNYRPKT
jgi:hypothetical protein